MKKIAILQSNYIPWKGYFDLINMVDEFIIFDDAQYTKNDWRNRNKIKTSQGVKWLTVPIYNKCLNQKIKETKVSDRRWFVKHWNSISQSYSKSKYFKQYKDVFEKFYKEGNEEYLSEINYKLIIEICNILGIKTKIRHSSEFVLVDGKTEKLLSICMQCKADIYVSGPSAKDYFEMDLAVKNKIQTEWIDYDNYSEYTQLYHPFEHTVSILDLIFNEGPNATKYMKSFNE